MAENVGNLLHRCAGPQQPARDTVPENMNPRAGPTAPLISGLNRALHDAGVDGLIIRRHMANKYGPV